MATTREHSQRRLPVIATVFVLVVIAAAAATYKLWLPRVYDLAALASDHSAGEHDHHHAHNGHSHDGDNHDGHSHDDDDHAHGGHTHDDHDHDDHDHDDHDHDDHVHDDHDHDDHDHHAEDSHAHGPAPGLHSHDHEGHAEDTSITLTPTGLKNIGFRPMTVSLGSFERTIRLPAIVVERPGHSQIQITAPLAGVVTKIYPVEGAAIEPNSPLFEIRLMHDELVVAQRDFLRTAENLNVVNREIERLKSVGEGVIAGKRILEQQYEQQKLQATLLAERQALLLHGLQEQQIDDIVRNHRLLPSLTVRAPVHDHSHERCSADHLFHIQKLPVKLGQHVQAGELLSVLADHCELYIEGRAFEDDALRLREVANEDRTITATVVAGRTQTDAIKELRLLYLSDQIDADTRAFRFYVRLPNTVVVDKTDDDGRRFIAWRFNPGQRMELRVPVERWEDRIVLPAEAIVEESAETYVYQQYGDHFDRVPVHVEYRDQQSVVVSNDGSIKPGDIVAARGAYQMHLALKNKTGGGVDPHAGHTH